MGVNGVQAVSLLVVVSDIVSSRALEASRRQALQEWIVALAPGPLQFRFTGGDEFEWVLPDAAESLDTLLRLRATLGAGDEARGLPGVGLRCGIGRGAVTVRSERGPYAEDGPAYHRARAAYERMRAASTRRRRSFQRPFEPRSEPERRRTVIDDGHEDPPRDALLAFMDELLVGWKRTSWEAIALALGGARYEDAAAALGISVPAFYKRLESARLNSYLVGHQALKAAWRPHG